MSKSESLARELCKAQAAVEQAQIPLTRLAMAEKALVDAESKLSGYDLIVGEAWSDWAKTGDGKQPSANTKERMIYVADIDAAKSMVEAAHYAARPFAHVLNEANANLARVHAQIHQHRLETVMAKAEDMAVDYLYAVEHAAHLYSNLIGIDSYIEKHFSDCYHNSRVAGIRHSRHVNPEAFVAPGFDMKVLDNKSKFIVPTRPDHIAEGLAIAAKSIED